MTISKNLSHLESLPTEILSGIVQYLFAKANSRVVVRDMRSLSLTCRRLNELVKHSNYELPIRITMTSNPKCHVGVVSLPPRDASRTVGARSLRIFLEHPSYMGRYRALPFVPTAWSYQTAKKDGVSVESLWFQKTIHAYILFEPWIVREDFCGLMVDLLQMCPRLRSLRFDVFDGNVYFGHDGNLVQAGELRELVINRMNRVEHLLKLGTLPPSLTRLELDGVNVRDMDEYRETLSALPNLSELILRDVTPQLCRAACMGLEASKAPLRRLVISQFVSWEEEEEEEEVHMASLIGSTDALINAKPPLEELYLGNLRGWLGTPDLLKFNHAVAATLRRLVLADLPTCHFPEGCVWPVLRTLEMKDVASLGMGKGDEEGEAKTKVIFPVLESLSVSRMVDFGAEGDIFPALQYLQLDEVDPSLVAKIVKHDLTKMVLSPYYLYELYPLLEHLKGMMIDMMRLELNSDDSLSTTQSKVLEEMVLSFQNIRGIQVDTLDEMGAAGLGGMNEREPNWSDGLNPTYSSNEFDEPEDSDEYDGW